eukprot:m.40045 g.40045  ORF g.40045 m.40045 type:complete len:365 (-) comp10314_c0_seq1:87-1181(-)
MGAFTFVSRSSRLMYRIGMGRTAASVRLSSSAAMGQRLLGSATATTTNSHNLRSNGLNSHLLQGSRGVSESLRCGESLVQTRMMSNSGAFSTEYTGDAFAADLEKQEEKRPFSNVAVNCDFLPNTIDEEHFANGMNTAIQRWKNTGFDAAWMLVPVEKAWVASMCASSGFQMHHCEDNTIHMMLWMDPNRDCAVPHFNTHQVGVGGLVLRDDLHLLAIKEKNAITKGYKLPGGRVDPGEDLSEAVVREVFEETGIQTRFHSVLGLRHINSFFNKNVSDIYTICRLVPETFDIEKCDVELSEAVWLHFDDYIDNTFPANANLFKELREHFFAADGQHNSIHLPCDMTEHIYSSPYSNSTKMHYYY